MQYFKLLYKYEVKHDKVTAVRFGMAVAFMLFIKEL